MANIRSAYAPSPWRLRLQFDGAGSLDASTYAIARKDSGPGSPSIVAAFLSNAADTSTVDLTFASPLLEGTVFTVTQGGTSSADCSYFTPLTNADRISSDDDPEAEALGIDFAWIDGDPDAAGDCPRRRGLESFKHDLPMRALLNPGDLIQEPSAGGGLYPKINSPGSDAELLEDAGRVESDLRSDPRAEAVQIDVVNNPDGTAEMRMLVKPVALDSFIEVKPNG